MPASSVVPLDASWLASQTSEFSGFPMAAPVTAVAGGPSLTLSETGVPGEVERAPVGAPRPENDTAAPCVVHEDGESVDVVVVGVAVLDQLEGRHAGRNPDRRVVEGERRILGPEGAADLHRKLELDAEPGVTAERDPRGRAVHRALEDHAADGLIAPVHRLDGLGGQAHLVAGGSRRARRRRNAG